MKRLSGPALVVVLLIAAPARAAIILEFFEGTSQNDLVLSLNPFPGGIVFLCPDTPRRFVQIALRQTAPTNLLDAGDGLAAYLIQGVFGPNFVYRVPATNNLPSGTTPVVNVADPGTYSLVRSYRTGPNGNMPGGSAATATAFRFGGLNLNPPPSPSVDANGRIFLGTVAIEAIPGSPGGFDSTLIFQDPNAAAGTIDNITDLGDNIDEVLFAGGATYTLPIHNNILACIPEPSSAVLAGLVAIGVFALRYQRKKAAPPIAPEGSAEP